MTISQVVDYFDILQDKYGSPYFTTSEKERFLNQAQLNIVLDHLPLDGDAENVEKNANTWMVFNPLSFSTSVAMDSSGVITKASLESALTTSLGFTVKIIRPLSIIWTDSTGTRPVKGPTRQNNWATYLNNSFKEPVTSEPRYYESNSSYVISPINTTISITVNGIRYPKDISVADDQGPELAEIYHNEVVAKALELAGVGSRDQMLLELKRMNG